MTAGHHPSESLEACLSALSNAFTARYGEDLSRLVASMEDGRAVVCGTVVVPRQLRELERALRDWAVGAGVDDAEQPTRIVVKVLSELDDDDPALAGCLEHAGSEPTPLYSRRSGGALVSEWLPEDGAVRVLWAAEDRWLVQMPDGAVGWCAAPPGRPAGPSGPSVPVVRALGPGATRPVDAAQMMALADAALATAEAGVPYRLGGRSVEGGLDCSALVQRLIHNHTGALLPRHSSDQMKVGQRVPRSQLDRGDLIFARTLERNVMHVGLMIDGARLVHACRLDGRVKVETLGDFLARYRFLRAQRIFLVTR